MSGTSVIAKSASSIGIKPHNMAQRTTVVPLYGLLLEAIRLVVGQPSLLFVPLQAFFVGALMLLLPAVLAGGEDSLAIYLIWISASLALSLYASAAVWGSLVEAAVGLFSAHQFWAQGLRYFGRTVFGLVWAVVLMLPALIFVLLVWSVSTGIFSAAATYLRLGTPGVLSSRWASFAIVAAWLINLFWAGRRLVVKWPRVMASGTQGKAIEVRILRERGWEVTRLWLMLLAFFGIIVVAYTELGLAAVVKGIVAELRDPVVTDVPGPGSKVSIPLMTEVKKIILTAPVPVFTAWALLCVFEMLKSLFCVVYYRLAGGGAAWFLPGTAKATENNLSAKARDRDSCP